MGPGDHHCHEGQKRICTVKARDRHDVIFVEEKLDGSCCAVAKIGGVVLALTRAGYEATTSPFVQHHYFAAWVRSNMHRFSGMLPDGARCVGEWLAQAHGTRYDLPHEPFVVFDVVGPDNIRVPVQVRDTMAADHGLVTPRLIHRGAPLSVDDALDAIEASGHGAIDPVEGAVWRVERKGTFEFLAKYVRPDKKDGVFLPEVSGTDPIWHWKPGKEQS